VDQLISYLADIHQPHQILPDIILVHGLDIYASLSAAVIVSVFSDFFLIVSHAIEDVFIFEASLPLAH